jgi:polyphosphate kinase
VEVLFPLAESKLIERVHDDMLMRYLADTVKARRMLPDGTYVRRKPSEGKRAFNTQEALIAKRRALANNGKAMMVRGR